VLWLGVFLGVSYTVLWLGVFVGAVIYNALAGFVCGVSCTVLWLGVFKSVSYTVLWLGLLVRV
jgi:hypothetical protein